MADSNTTENKVKPKYRLLAFFQAVPDILLYQIASKTLLFLLMYILRAAMSFLLSTAGRSAVTSGDFLFLLATPQGLVLIRLSVATLFLYTSMDIFTKIILSEELLMGREHRVAQSIRNALRAIPGFFSLPGLVVILYISLIAPLVGVGVSITATESLYVPNFITSVIYSNPLFTALYVLVLIVFTVIGLLNIFVLHGVLLNGLSVRESWKQSADLIKKNLKSYLVENIRFSLSLLLLNAIMALVLFRGPAVVMTSNRPADESGRIAFMMLSLAGSILIGLVSSLATPFFIMNLTRLYHIYRDDGTMHYPSRKIRFHPLMIRGVIGIYAVSFLVAGLVNEVFDEVSRDIPVEVVAHRGGGYEGAENTVRGLEKAIELGAWGSEIDIQRTLDGEYVINHDSTFQRVGGVNRKPESMTLREIRQIRVDGQPVPTLEEMLEAARGRIKLLIELKGSTADRQMADDAVRIVKEMGMEKEVIFISLKYELVDYIESSYPEMDTGLLAFMVFGDIGGLNCDYVCLEEERASQSAISDVHSRGKKILVWTVDTDESMKHFLLSSADGIITDDISGAMEKRNELNDRDDYTRIIDIVLPSLTGK